MAADDSEPRLSAVRATEHRRCSAIVRRFLRGGFAAFGAFAAVLAASGIGGSQGVVVALDFSGWTRFVGVFRGVRRLAVHVGSPQASGSSTSWATFTAGESLWD